MEITAIIPIKHHSSRVPGKNYRLLNGKPLYWYILETLSNVHAVTRIVVDTDSDVIVEGCRNFFPHVVVYIRPEELRGDNVSTNKLLLRVVKDLNLQSDLYLHTHTTNPLLTSETIINAIKTLTTDKTKDSLFTVNRWHTRLYDKNETPMNHNLENLIPTQDLDPIYEENSCLYLVPHDILMSTGRRIGLKPHLYVMDLLEAVDIDWESDFAIAEAILRSRVKHDRRVLITGSSGGIGSIVCAHFAKAGWYVIGVDIVEPTPLQRISLNDFICGDLSDSNIGTIVRDALGNRSLHSIVNCAAIQINGTLNNLSVKDWDRTFNCNLRSIYLIAQALHQKLQVQGGSIVNISSVHAINTSIGIGAYASAKGGLEALTRAMSLEYAPHIRVNAIRPGAIATPMLIDGLQRGHSDGVKALSQKIPAECIGDPSDIAELALFLCENAAYTTGSVYTADGGVGARLSSE